MKKLNTTFAAVFFVTMLTMAGVSTCFGIVPATPHPVYVSIDNIDGLTPASDDLLFDAWLLARPGEVGNQDSFDWDYGNTIAGTITINCGNVFSYWDAGDILHIEAEQISTGYAGIGEYTLTNDNYQFFSGDDGITVVPEPSTLALLGLGVLSLILVRRRTSVKKAIAIFAVATLFLTIGSAARCATVTGDPSADDGWFLAGHSLQNGVYVEGEANYGYLAYGAGFTVEAGSNMEISDGALSWLAGDSVVGVGGKFETITAAAAGWDEITGRAINSLLPTSSPYVGPKLQAKFGTSDATWTASTTAPDDGDASGSSSLGGGRVQVRTSGYFQAGTPNPGQTEPWTWDGNSGQLLVLDKESHIEWDGDSSLDKRVARMIWVWDGTENQVASWQLLLNVSLLDRVAPEGFTGLLPAVGDLAIMTVQDSTGKYTNALVATVPEPSTFVLLGLGALSLILISRRRA